MRLRVHYTTPASQSKFILKLLVKLVWRPHMSKETAISPLLCSSWTTPLWLWFISVLVTVCQYSVLESYGHRDSVLEMHHLWSSVLGMYCLLHHYALSPAESHCWRSGMDSYSSPSSDMASSSHGTLSWFPLSDTWGWFSLAASLIPSVLACQATTSIFLVLLQFISPMPWLGQLPFMSRLLMWEIDHNLAPNPDSAFPCSPVVSLLIPLLSLLNGLTCQMACWGERNHQFPAIVTHIYRVDLCDRAVSCISWRPTVYAKQQERGFFPSWIVGSVLVSPRYARQIPVPLSSKPRHIQVCFKVRLNLSTAPSHCGWYLTW